MKNRTLLEAVAERNQHEQTKEINASEFIENKITGILPFWAISVPAKMGKRDWREEWGQWCEMKVAKFTTQPQRMNQQIRLEYLFILVSNLWTSILSRMELWILEMGNRVLKNEMLLGINFLINQESNAKFYNLWRIHFFGSKEGTKNVKPYSE